MTVHIVPSSYIFFELYLVKFVKFLSSSSRKGANSIPEHYRTASREQLRAVKVEQCSNNRTNWNQKKQCLCSMMKTLPVFPFLFDTEFYCGE